MNLGKDGQIPEDFRRKKPIKVTKMTVLGKSRHEVHFALATKLARDHVPLVIRITEGFVETEAEYDGVLTVEQRAVTCGFLHGFLHGLAFALEGIISGKINIKELEITGE